MKTLIKWLAVAALAGGALYGAVNYNVVVTPVAAQEAACITLESEKIRIADNLTKAGIENWNVVVYHNEVADNFIANLAKSLGINEDGIKVIVEAATVVAVFSAEGVDSDYVEVFDINGCLIIKEAFPSSLVKTLTSEAGV
jgi:hypothetical protein